MFQSCTNKPAFEGLLRIIRFLASYLNRPLIYTRDNATADIKIE